MQKLYDQLTYKPAIAEKMLFEGRTSMLSRSSDGSVADSDLIEQRTRFEIILERSILLTMFLTTLVTGVLSYFADQNDASSLHIADASHVEAFSAIGSDDSELVDKIRSSYGASTGTIIGMLVLVAIVSTLSQSPQKRQVARRLRWHLAVKLFGFITLTTQYTFTPRGLQGHRLPLLALVLWLGSAWNQHAFYFGLLQAQHDHVLAGKEDSPSEEEEKQRRSLFDISANGPAKDPLSPSNSNGVIITHRGANNISSSAGGVGWSASSSSSSSSAEGGGGGVTPLAGAASVMASSPISLPAIGLTRGMSYKLLFWRWAVDLVQIPARVYPHPTIVSVLMVLGTLLSLGNWAAYFYGFAPMLRDARTTDRRDYHVILISAGLLFTSCIVFEVSGYLYWCVPRYGHSTHACTATLAHIMVILLTTVHRV